MSAVTAAFAESGHGGPISQDRAECVGHSICSLARPNACTEAILLAHGFTTDLLVDLVHAGLAIAMCTTSYFISITVHRISSFYI
jgi:hypothetical protein